MALLRSLAALMKPGDYATVLLGALLVVALVHLVAAGPAGDSLVVRTQGRVVAELSLTASRTLDVPGVLGDSTIEVSHGKARVVGDPGPRQLCVKQGWISQAGESLLCLANQVTLEIPARAGGIDTLAY
jgi:hypothetical protein